MQVACAILEASRVCKLVRPAQVMAWSTAAAEGGGHGRRHARRERQAYPAQHAARQRCCTLGCERSFRTGRRAHVHCCSQCSVGEHTDRCDHAWTKFIHRMARQNLSVFVVESCDRVAGLQHIHYCRQPPNKAEVDADGIEPTETAAMEGAILVQSSSSEAGGGVY